jgi:rare lipoprotein A
MVIKRKSRNMSLKTPLRICLLAGASSVALAAVVVTISTRTVHADAVLPRPTATTPHTPPFASAPPAALLASPKTAPKTAPRTAREKRADILHGIASWYGGVFNGRKTASGEKFDMYAMTACHPTLPFGTLVRVHNRDNNRSVVVRITDRGDLVVEGRIIDLSYGAAQELAMTKAGLARVDLEVISLGHPRGKK